MQWEIKWENKIFLLERTVFRRVPEAAREKDSRTESEFESFRRDCQSNATGSGADWTDPQDRECDWQSARLYRQL